MVKQNPKEKLNNKATKMIDLALDEVYNGGEKTISASFMDSKDETKKYTLTIGVNVSWPEETEPVDDDF